ncbi:MAG: Rrf2 family transcriptional regulator [Spirochaetales bacterium]|nr:Rrf2 family transcriptional regulator [Spirochaetales bacterium]
MSYSLAYTQSIAVLICVGARNELLRIERVPAAYLAETLGIPRSTVVGILTRLVAAGLLESREGKKGGVRLTRPAKAITLLDVFDAIERKRPLFSSDLPADPDRKEIVEARRRVLECFAAAEAAVRKTLSSVTINTLFGVTLTNGTTRR